MAIKRSEFTGRFHRIVEAGNVIYLAGVTARNAGEDAGAQTADVLTQIDELLVQAGVSKRDVVSANIWLADIGDSLR
jgi:enamine deaminase RidA (YjgF/YER057c/UK114 family)